MSAPSQPPRHSPRPHINRPVDEDAVRTLSRELPIHPRVARVLAARGLDNADAARRFLAPTLQDIRDPFLMAGMPAATELLADAVMSGRPIVLFGDYDVDGITSTSLMRLGLSSMGLAPAAFHLPDRLREGYGLNTPSALKLAKQAQGGVFISLDCGITAVDEVEAVRRAGLDVIVVDHHQLGPRFPNAAAVLNPWQPGCGFPFKGLCAAGVAFMLLVGLRKTLRDRGHFAAASLPEPNLRRLLDIVAVGTLADMVPLTAENRVFVQFGLRELARAERPGMLALLQVAGLEPHRLRASDIGFQVAPRLNAAGRVGDAQRGVHLLCTADMHEAITLAGELDRDNQRRREIEEETRKAAASQLRERRDELAAEGRRLAGAVLWNEGWHPGVIGIVAARLVEEFRIPVFMVAFNGPPEANLPGRGSGRTAHGLNLHTALTACGEHLVQYGGHAAAAGLSALRAKMPAFRAAFEAWCEAETTRMDAAHAMAETVVTTAIAPTTEATAIPPLDNPRAIKLDGDLYTDELDFDFLADLARLEPFGIENPEPSFQLRHQGIEKIWTVSNGRHLKIRFRGPRGAIEGIGFHRGYLHGQPLDEARIVVFPEQQSYMGRQQIVLRLQDVPVLGAEPSEGHA